MSHQTPRLQQQDDKNAGGCKMATHVLETYSQLGRNVYLRLKVLHVIFNPIHWLYDYTKTYSYRLTRIDYDYLF